MTARTRIAALAMALCLAGCPQTDDDDTAGPPDDDDSGSSDDDSGVAADDDDTVETVEQQPVTVSVVNATDAPLYIPWLEWWSEGLNSLLTCAVQVGDAWASCLYGLPYGVTECTEANLGGYCPGEPDGGSAVLVLEPGPGTDVVWPGTLWAIDTEHCLDGVCARPDDPAAGHYAVSVTAWTDMGCFFGDCPPAKGGLVWDAYVTGDSTSCDGEFDVPLAGDSLELTFE